MRALNAKMIKYGFATGRVRVLETRLIGWARIKRLIEADNLDEAHHVLAETDYASDIRTADTLIDIERALEKKERDLQIMLQESNVPFEMVRFFQSRVDIMNLRIILKSGYGQEIPVELSPYGEVHADELQLLVREGAFSGLPAYLEAAADDAVAEYTIEPRSAVIDTTIDRHYFKGLLDLSAGLRSPWITEYARLLIDLANGRISVRSRQKKTTPDDLLENLLNGGRVDKSIWSAFFSKSKNLISRLKDIPTLLLREGLIDWVQRDASVDSYDLLSGNILIKYLETAGTFNVGPETVFAYVATKEHEIKIVRIIMAGHIGGLAPERLRERVSAIYE